MSNAQEKMQPEPKPWRQNKLELPKIEINQNEIIGINQNAKMIRPATWENQECGFWPGLTQTSLYSHWRWLEAWKFVFRKWRYCTIQVAKIKALISIAVTAKLICIFVFAYADCCFFSWRGSYMVNRLSSSFPKAGHWTILTLLNNI